MITMTQRHRPISTISPRARFLEAIPTDEDDIKVYTCRISFRSRCKNILINLVPFAIWIQRYPWRKYILKDIISGITVSVLLVPQGLAYAQLADCPPVVGLYMGTFPCLIYAFLSFSRHVSYGPMALICLMTDAVITDIQSVEEYKDLERIVIGTAISFTVGLCYIIMFVFRMGIICLLLTKTFISSFTTGVSVHIFTSQMKELLGIKLKKHFGVLGIVEFYEELISRINETNIMSCTIGISTILILELCETFLKPILLRRGIIFPAEFVVLVVTGLISYLLRLPVEFDIRTVGEVPKGFPEPSIPKIGIVLEAKVLLRCLIMSVVAYFITESNAFFYAGMRRYKVDPQQDFLAQGAATFVGSFLSCLPVAGSISRSAVQERLGGETQMASITAVVIMILVLFFMADWLYPIPRAALAGITIATFLTIFKKSFADIKAIWFLSRREFLVWVLTFSTVVFVGIDIGLGCGLMLSLTLNVVHRSDPQLHLVGRVRVGDEDVYTELKQEVGGEVPGVKIVQINGAVDSVSRDHVQRRVYDLTGVTPANVADGGEEEPSDVESARVDEFLLVPFKLGNPRPDDSSVAAVVTEKLQFIVLDATYAQRVDFSGLGALQELAAAYDEVGVGVALVTRDARLSPLSNLASVVRQLERAVQVRASSPGSGRGSGRAKDFVAALRTE